MKQFYFISLLLVMAGVSKAQTSLNAGEVMITGFYSDSFDVEDGCGDAFSFVSYVPLASGTVIRFSEADYHNWATSNDGGVAWTNDTGATIPALTNINIVSSNEQRSCAEAPIADIGTAVYEYALEESFWSLSTSNEEIIVYQGPGPRAANTFISIFLSDNTSVYPNNVPAPLLSTNNVITFDTIIDDVDIAVYDGPTTFSSFADFKTQLTNVAVNWSGQKEGGGVDNGKDGIYPDYPDDLPVFAGNLSTTDFKSLKISFYPNPVGDYLIIDANVTISNVFIYNSLGKEIYKNLSFENRSNHIDMSKFQAGIYFLKVGNTDSSQTFKVVKQ